MKTFQKALSRSVALVMAFNLIAGTALALATELATPVVTKPAQNEMLHNLPREATVEWTAVSGAEKYNVEIDMGWVGSTTWINAYKKTVTGTSVKTTNLGSDNPFRVRVQAAAGTTVGNWSNYRNFIYRTAPVVVPVSAGKIFATGKYEGGEIKIDWAPATVTIGNVFDKYNVRWKKGSWGWLGAQAEGVGNAYVTDSYYNFTLSEPGNWSFMVMPVKWVDGKYKEVGEYANSAVVTIPTPAPAPANVGKVFITGKLESGWIKLDWAPLAGLGTTFDKYNVRSRSENALSFEMDAPGVRNAYVDFDYYNTTREEGTWYFKVIPVKWVDGKYKEVGEAGNPVAITVPASAPVETKTDCEMNPPKIGTIYEYGQNFALNGSQTLTFDLTKGNNITHYWSTCKEATKYLLQYSGDNFNSHINFWGGSSNNVGIAGMTLGNQLKDMIKNNGGKIAMRVRAVTEKGNVDGPVLGFNAEIVEKPTPVQVLATPSMVSPASNEVLKNFPRTAYLSWTGIANATSYDIQVACDSCGNTAWQSVSSYSSTNNWYTTQALTGDNQFRARVHAVDAVGNAGNWSEYRYFSYSTAATNNNNADSIGLSIVSWSNATPLLQWSAYTDKDFDGYAMFVREGTWDKNKVTWVDPTYFEKTKTSHQITKVFLDTTYTVRIIPYLQKSTGKEMIYPASNTLVFKTGKDYSAAVPAPGGTYCGNGKGNAAGNDGSYDVCVGDTIDHEETFVTVKILKITSKQVKLQIDGADKNIIILKNTSKGGKSKTLKTDADMLLTIRFTGISGSSGGAMIQLTSQDIN